MVLVLNLRHCIWTPPWRGADLVPRPDIFCIVLWLFIYSIIRKVNIFKNTASQKFTSEFQWLTFTESGINYIIISSRIPFVNCIWQLYWSHMYIMQPLKCCKISMGKWQYPFNELVNTANISYDSINKINPLVYSTYMYFEAIVKKGIKISISIHERKI